MTTKLEPRFEHLFDLGRNLFATILVRDSQDANTWNHRAETFSRHGLVHFITEAQFKPKEIEIDRSRLDDSRYRRHLIRQLKAPRPGKYRTVKLFIDRERLTSDVVYLHQIAAVLSYKWTHKLKTDNPVWHLMLKHQDVETLTHCLERMGLHQSEPELVSDNVLRTIVERELDNSPGYLKCVEGFRAAVAPVRAEFERNVKAIAADALAHARADSEEIAEVASMRFARLSEVIRNDFAAQAAGTDAVLAECKPSGLSPEEEFRQTVLEREREWREQNKLSRKAKLLIGATMAGLAALAAKFVEFNGVTLVETLP